MLDQVYMSFLKETVDIKVVCLEPESDGYKDTWEFAASSNYTSFPASRESVN